MQQKSLKTFYGINSYYVILASYNNVFANDNELKLVKIVTFNIQFPYILDPWVLLNVDVTYPFLKYLYWDALICAVEVI